MNNKTLRATTILVGTTIGAGIFGIPYAIAQVGFLAGLIYLLVLGGVVLLLNLIYGEVILRTPGDHQLTGYGQIYLGQWGKVLASLALLVSLYGALLAYLIKIGEFLSLIFNIPYSLEFSLAFFLLAFLAVFLGLRAISQIELVLVGLLLIFILLIALVGLPYLSPFHLSGGNILPPVTNQASLFLPYGVILFALAGSAAVPEMEEILRHQPTKLKKAIILGSLVPLLVYLVFTFIIVSISGSQTSDDAISSLGLFLPNWVVSLGAGLGILTMATSFLALGYVLKEVWFRDFQLSPATALLLACIPPLVWFLSGTQSFIFVLKITGALTGGLTGILILILYRKARKMGQKKPVYQLRIPTAILWLLAIVFLLGIFSPFLS